MVARGGPTFAAAALTPHPNQPPSSRTMFDRRCDAYYSVSVIRSFGNSSTRRLFEEGRRRGFRGLDYDRALLLLDALDAAPGLDALRALQTTRLHALRGPMQGRWAMTVNSRWRVTFRFGDGNAHDVSVEDYHKG